MDEKLIEYFERIRRAYERIPSSAPLHNEFTIKEKQLEIVNEIYAAGFLAAQEKIAEAVKKLDWTYSVTKMPSKTFDVTEILAAIKSVKI